MLNRLRALSRIAGATGLVASLAEMFYVGRGQRSIFLIVLFTIWVASPFAAVGWMDATFTRSQNSFRAAVYLLAIVIAVVSPTIYGVVAFGPPRPQPASFFLLTPFASWVLIAVLTLLNFVV